jgi:hypothetical protein
MPKRKQLICIGYNLLFYHKKKIKAKLEKGKEKLLFSCLLFNTYERRCWRLKADIRHNTVRVSPLKMQCNPRDIFRNDSHLKETEFCKF